MNELLITNLSQTRNSRDIAIAGEQAKALAAMQAKIILAKQYPRSESQAIANVMTSLSRIGFAEKASYSFPRGNAVVSGASVYLAREIARCWGNIVHQIRIVHHDEDYTTIEGVAWDLETNSEVISQATFANLVQRKAKDSAGKPIFEGGKAKTEWVKPDERDFRELVNKHGAICVRNALLQLFPRDLIEDFREKAKETQRKGISNDSPVVARAKILQAFDKFGIKQDHLENFLDIKIDSWSDDDIVELRGIYLSITDGQMDKMEIIGAEKKAVKTDIASILSATEVKADSNPSRKKDNDKSKEEPVYTQSEGTPSAPQVLEDKKTVEIATSPDTTVLDNPDNLATETQRTRIALKLVELGKSLTAAFHERFGDNATLNKMTSSQAAVWIMDIDAEVINKKNMK